MSTLKQLSNDILTEKNTKIIPENIKKDIQIFDITGTYEGSGGGSGDVKLFNSVSSMKNSSGNKDGDLALVYSNSISNLHEDDIIDIAIFPDTVVLPEAVTEEKEYYFSPVSSSEYIECRAMLLSSNFYFNWYGDSSYGNIEYSSSDGITYTKTSGDAQVDFSDTPLKCEYGYDTNLSYFIQLASTSFDGVYEYSTKADKNLFYLYKVGDKALDTTKKFYIPNILMGNDYGNNPAIVIPTQYHLDNELGYYIIDKCYQFAPHGYLNYCGGVVYDSSNNAYLGRCPSADASATTMLEYDFTSSDKYYNKTYTSNARLINGTKVIGNIGYALQLTDYIFSDSPDRKVFTYTYTLDSGGSYSEIDVPQPPIEVSEYRQIKSQLNVDKFKVLEGTFYGKNGIEDGDLNKTTNLNADETKLRLQLKDLYSNLSPISMHNLFMYNKGTSINISNDINTVLTTDISNLFFGCANLTNISNFNTSNVTNASMAFRLCNNLTTLPNIDTSKVKDASEMFCSCYNITNLPEFDFSNAINIESIFAACPVSSIPNYNFINAVNMHAFVAWCNNLTSIPTLSTSNVTDLSQAFTGCSNLTTVPNFNTINVLTMRSTFESMAKITSIPAFDTSNVTDMGRLCYNCQNLSNIPQLNVSNVQTMEQAFWRCNSLTTASLHNIINMCLNSNIPRFMRNLNNSNSYSPFYYTKFNKSYYTNRYTELNSAGWIY